MARKNKAAWAVLFLTAILFFAPAKALSAAEKPDPGRSLSLSMTLKTPGENGRIASDAEVTAYLIADAVFSSRGIDYVLTDAFTSTGLELDGNISQSMVDDLVKHAGNNNISGISERSDTDGNVVFDGLSAGVYLVTATSLPEGFTSFVPFLYFLPHYDYDSLTWIYDGTAEPKIEYLPPVNVSVRKIWNDNGLNRPEYVNICLINEDGVYDTVRLNAQNSWKHTWENLDAGKKWSVEETDIPKNYTATYSSEGFAFTVTNTEKLIQTGQIDWPVPLLLFAGSFLVSAGIVLKVIGRKADEK